MIDDCSEFAEWVRAVQTLDTSRIIIMPAKLHVRKHISESILQHKSFLKHFFGPLFGEILPYAKEKWKALKKVHTDALSSEQVQGDERSLHEDMITLNNTIAATIIQDSETVEELLREHLVGDEVAGDEDKVGEDVADQITSAE